MEMTKAQQRRAKMQVFKGHVQAERDRLTAQNLSAQELVELFECGNFFTELAASGLLLERGKPAGMEAVLRGLEHPKWKVRRTCADFLDHWGDQSCIQPLTRLLQDPIENVRRLALHSLLCQACKECPLEGDFTEPVVDRALHDKSLRVRRIAVGALGGLPSNARIREALQILLEQETDTVLVSRARHSLHLQQPPS
jgi:HEAT repeat protein